GPAAGWPGTSPKAGGPPPGAPGHSRSLRVRGGSAAPCGEGFLGLPLPPRSPQGARMLHGVDVSSYQPASYDTDGLSFVFVKATEGRTYTSPKLTDQTKRARDAGLVVGFYHFLWPGDLTAQAEHFLGEAPLRPGDVLAVDWETTGGGTRASAAEKDRFLREVKERAQDHRVVL